MTSTPPAPCGDCQFEIYAGLGGVVPALPMAYPELAARAAALPPSVLLRGRPRTACAGSLSRD